MSRIRNRLESYVVRNAGEVLDELADERREELAEVLPERELRAAAGDLAQRDRDLSLREGNLATRVEELEQRSDERLITREQAVKDREAALASADGLAATHKQSLERRKVQIVESERAVR